MFSAQFVEILLGRSMSERRIWHQDYQRKILFHYYSQGDCGKSGQGDDEESAMLDFSFLENLR